MIWTHNICRSCWNTRNPHKGEPVTVTDKTVYKCCSCGKTHSSGIFIRENPQKLKCKGDHT